MRGKYIRWIAAICVAVVTVCGTVGAARRIHLAAATVKPLPIILIDAGHAALENTID